MSEEWARARDLPGEEDFLLELIGIA